MCCRFCKRKALSNEDWVSPTNADARIEINERRQYPSLLHARHTVDLNIGIVTAAVIHLTDQGDATMLPGPSRRLGYSSKLCENR